jgi:hypothetical protein
MLPADAKIKLGKSSNYLGFLTFTISSFIPFNPELTVKTIKFLNTTR